MPALAPGVLCEIVPARCAPEAINQFVGMRCIALGPDLLMGVVALLAGAEGHQVWIAELENGQTISLCRQCLKPLDPPREDDATWGRIREITGWTPAKEKTT